MNKSLLLTLAVVTLVALPAQASRGRRAKDAKARETRLVEKALSERFKEMFKEKMPGFKAKKVFKGNSYKDVVPEISSLLRRAGISRELPLTFQNAQGLGRNVKKAMASYMMENAKLNAAKSEEVAEIHKTLEGRSILGMYQKVIQAEQVLNIAKQLQIKGETESKLIKSAETMYAEAVKLFEASLHKYKNLATNSSKRDPLKDPEISEQLKDLASFIAFGSIHLNTVLTESLRNGDVAALDGFFQRARAFNDVITQKFSTSPMTDAISQILKQQGVVFKNYNEQKKEVQREKRLQNKECG